MTLTFNLIGKGVALGLGAAAPIGPVNVEIARRTLRSGFLAGFALGCGAVSVDVTYAVLSSFSLARLLNRSAVLWPITIGGVAFLLYLAILCFAGAVRDFRGDPLAGSEAAQSHGAAYLVGVLMTLLNPMTLGFWFLAVPATIGPITKEPTRDLPMICGGVFIGTIGWVVAYAGGLAWAGRWRRSWWLAAADLLGGIVLFAFAVAQIWHALRRFL